MSGSLLTAPQVAAMLGVPVSWVYEQSRRGAIPTVTLGRYRRYRLEAIEAWISAIEAQDGGHPTAGRASVGHEARNRKQGAAWRNGAGR